MIPMLRSLLPHDPNMSMDGCSPGAAIACRRGASALLLALVLGAACPASAQSPEQFLRRPDVHGDQVVFTSEGDLWLGSISQGTASRITSDEGFEGPAFFSPEGSRIAFAADYDGGRDVYMMDLDGGAPMRLTWDPTGVTVLGWTPDGSGVLFRSARGTTMRNRIWRVPAAGGAAELLPIPYGEFASIHADGQRIAYVPMSGEWQHWKRYRGGHADDIWLAETASGTFTRLTDDLGVDTEPVWVGDLLYFVSERGGLANLYTLDPATRAATPVTAYTDYDVRYPQTDGTRVVFEHGDGIAIHDPATGGTTELPLNLRSDRIHARSRRVAALDHLTGLDLSPTGKRVLVTARGQVLSAPAEHGEVRAVAAEPGSRRQYAAWSPDGKEVAFVSDQSGEDQIWIAPAAGGEARQVTRDHVGPLGPIVWSPDGARLATSDRELRILLVDVKSGAMTTVDQCDRGGSYDMVLDSFVFSPDGKWLAYSFYEPSWSWSVRLYEIRTQQRTQVTDPVMNCYRPAFDPEGRLLYFLADREFSARYTNGNRYFTYDAMTKVSLVTLTADGKSPFLPRNDQEGGEDEDAAKDEKGEKSGDKKGTKEAASLPEMRIDVAGIAARVDEVPVPAAYYTRVEPVEGKLLLETYEDRDDEESAATPRKLQSFDLEKREAKVLVEKLTGFDLSADREKLLVRQDKSFTILEATAEAMPEDEGRVPTDGWTLLVDPAAEWRQIFHETWRIARDFFYDPNMHGVDWPAIRAKYEPMLGAVAVRSDLSFVLGEMVAELNCGHAYIAGGDAVQPERVPMGFLGADLEPVAGETPAYRIARLLTGDEFDFETRSPLLAPGVNVSAGEFILAVGGQRVRADQDIQALLAGTAGRTVALTVNSRPSLDGAREVLVQPMGSEWMARHYDWVASRREYVRAHGGESLAYLHIPNMMNWGLAEFGKHYYANLDADGMIYDVRFNGGGYINAMLLLQMASPQYSYFKPRYGASWSRQDWAFPGHAVALCNDQSGSNAEEFSDAFQRLGLGPLIGTRSWGGEVGSGGGYPLIDGGAVYIPNYAAWVPGEGWIIEGLGAVPDRIVEEDPALLMAGRDPQLDAAIEYLKTKLAESPVPRPTPPPYPNKAEGGSDQW